MFQAGLEIGSDLVWSQSHDGLADGVAAFEFVGSAAAWGGAAEEVWGDGDVAGSRQIVGHEANPVTETKNLVNNQNGSGFLAHFGKDDKGFEFAVVMFELDPFAMAGRLFQGGLGPILGAGSCYQVNCRHCGHKQSKHGTVLRGLCANDKKNPPARFGTGGCRHVPCWALYGAQGFVSWNLSSWLLRPF